jgi:hypothetical protein
MHELEEIINRFSRRTYLKDRVGSAYIAPVREPNRILKEIMEYLVESDRTANSEVWARYFLKSLLDAHKLYSFVAINKSNRRLCEVYLTFLKICREFFFNYLQPVCWQAALKINQKFVASSNVNFNYPVEECFSIACVAISHPIKLFKGFDFKSYSSTEAYAFNSLKRIINNQIAKDLKAKSLKLSDNGLLRGLEIKELEKTLFDLQFTSQEITIYCLVLQAFQDLFESFFPANNNLGDRSRKPATTPLNNEQFSLIAKRYNQQIKRLELSVKLANDRDIKNILDRCVEAIRKKANPQSISFDESGIGEKIVDVTSNPLESYLKQEEKKELREVRELIVQSLNSLDSWARKSLILWLGLGINQDDFFEMLAVQQQFQVSRKFQTFQKAVFKPVIESLFQKELSQTLPKQEVNRIIASNLTCFKEYLRGYSRSIFTEILLAILDRDIDRTEKSLLKNSSARIKSLVKEQKENNNLNSFSLDSDEKKVRQKLVLLFRDRIEQQLEVSLEKFKSSHESMEKFIEIYLQENTAILY